MTALNSRYKHIGQVGGVYTVPAFRQKGYSMKCMIQYIHDCKKHHKLERLILFTSENNFKAQSLYKKLEFEIIGKFALFFGSHVE